MKFRLLDIKTIDQEVNKYPKKGSNNGLQFYTIRDINALMRNASFIEGNTTNGVSVSSDNIYQYGWLLYFKNNFKPSNNEYLYGNLSPLYPENITSEFKNTAAFYAFNNNLLVRKYYSRKTIENIYGSEIQSNCLQKELNKMYLFENRL
ncbi:hypothetical protein [Mycoplasmopsis primatum]|uniref:hypothetical protein n=1 Tax=Mycoplasmopsis primatum TaxID=55604 RepID=UPI000AE08694|nr:hypothetical protein [Mycoplasmopsis primatum]